MSIYTDLHRLIYFLSDFYPLFIFISIGLFTCVVSLKNLREIRCRDWLTRNPLTFYVLCACWVVFDIIGALAGNRPHAHYFLPLTLSVSVLVGLTYTLQRETTDEKGFGKFVQLNILALLIAPLIFTHFHKEVREFYHLIKYGHTLSHDLKIGHDKPSLTEHAKEIAAFVDKIRNPQDTLFSWSYEPWIFWALDIKSPIKVLDLGFSKIFSGSLQHQFGEGVLSELKSHPPTLILDTTENPQLLRRRDRLYSDFSIYVEDQFECVRQFPDGVRVFKRKQIHDTLSTVPRSAISGLH